MSEQVAEQIIQTATSVPLQSAQENLSKFKSGLKAETKKNYRDENFNFNIPPAEHTTTSPTASPRKKIPLTPEFTTYEDRSKNKLSAGNPTKRRLFSTFSITRKLEEASLTVELSTQETLLPTTELDNSVYRIAEFCETLANIDQLLKKVSSAKKVLKEVTLVAQKKSFYLHPQEHTLAIAAKDKLIHYTHFLRSIFDLKSFKADVTKLQNILQKLIAHAAQAPQATRSIATQFSELPFQNKSLFSFLPYVSRHMCEDAPENIFQAIMTCLTQYAEDLTNTFQQGEKTIALLDKLLNSKQAFMIGQKLEELPAPSRYKIPTTLFSPTPSLKKQPLAEKIKFARENYNTTQDISLIALWVAEVWKFSLMKDGENLAQSSMDSAELQAAIMHRKLQHIEALQVPPTSEIDIVALRVHLVHLRKLMQLKPMDPELLPTEVPATRVLISRDSPVLNRVDNRMSPSITIQPESARASAKTPPALH